MILDLDLANEYVITKKDVQGIHGMVYIYNKLITTILHTDYIQTTHSFYAKNDPDEKPRKPTSDTRDVSLLLSQRFERESKRILNEQNKLGRKGLIFFTTRHFGYLNSKFRIIQS